MKRKPITNPATQDASTKPERSFVGGVNPDHVKILEAALKQHPKLAHMGMLREGMPFMGIDPTPAALSRLAEVAQTNPQQFHSFVRQARSHYFMSKDALSNRRNRQQGKK